MLLNFKITATDFDGTLCEDKWPKIGKMNEEVIQYLKEEKAAGGKIILWTCRVNENLQEAIDKCKKVGLEFDAVNENVQEILDLFPVCGRKIYYDELIDDKHCGRFKLPYHPGEKKSNLQTWAEREVEIACKRERQENEDPEGTEWDYGCACYESALKAFKSFMGEGHTGSSIGLAKRILNRLIDGKPLGLIVDTDDVWNEITERNDEKGYSCLQCSRMSALFKYVYDDGTIKYKDIDNNLFINMENDTIWHSGTVQDIMDELFPVTMPYCPGEPTKFYGEEFLVDRKNGDFDTIGVLYAVKPDGERVKINRFYKEIPEGFKRITRLEYLIRKVRKVS